MKIFGDTEFLENGISIKPISFAYVAETGEEYYAINSDLELMARAYEHPWLRKNVLPKLPLFMDWDGDLVWDQSHEDYDKVKSLHDIKEDIKHFVLSFSNPEIWYYFGAYDHVVVSQLFGTMIQLPVGFPMWFHELMQELEKEKGFVPVEQSGGLHNALADARWIRDTYMALEERRKPSVVGVKSLPIPAHPVASRMRTRVW